jgi:hypothetical protein
MSTDIAGFGIQIQIRASNTFPSGFTVTQVADDADPFDLPEVVIAESAMGVNGDLITWSKANPLMPAVGVVPGSDDDINLGLLFEANRTAKGKQSARDVITMIAVYPNGDTLTFTEGRILAGPPGKAVASSGRFKSNVYKFAFENKTDTRAQSPTVLTGA